MGVLLSIFFHIFRTYFYKNTYGGLLLCSQEDVILKRRIVSFFFLAFKSDNIINGIINKYYQVQFVTTESINGCSTLDGIFCAERIVSNELKVLMTSSPKKPHKKKGSNYTLYSNLIHMTWHNDI